MYIKCKLYLEKYNFIMLFILFGVVNVELDIIWRGGGHKHLVFRASKGLNPSLTGENYSGKCSELYIWMLMETFISICSVMEIKYAKEYDVYIMDLWKRQRKSSLS